MVAWLCGAVLGSSVIFGGGTHAGFLGDVAVQLLSAPLMAAALWPILKPGQPDLRKNLAILAASALVILIITIQLFPLPFDVWSAGAGITANSSEPALILPDRGWATLSISPQATWAAAASLIVPTSIFLAVIQLELRHRILLSWLLLALGAAALLLGFLQVAQGSDSPLRFYAMTNPSEAVGFFANRNHFAAHLNVTLVLAAVWVVSVSNRMSEPGASRSRTILWATAAAVFLVSVVAGLAMARSRAGVLLAMAALVGIVCMAVRHHSEAAAQPRSHLFTGRRLPLITVLFAVLFAAQFGLGGVLSRFQSDPLDDLRWPLARTTLGMALKSLPFGTGLGTFVPVYATVEKDDDAIPAIANRAHNDFAELFLETGIPGILLLAVFLIWFARRTGEVWLGRESKEYESQMLLQRAATLVIALLLAHSLVDYPLRTTALSAVFAFFCGVLASNAPAPPSEPHQQKRRVAKDRSPVKVRRPMEKWDANVRWPESWQEPRG